MRGAIIITCAAALLTASAAAAPLPAPAKAPKKPAAGHAHDPAALSIEKGTVPITIGGPDDPDPIGLLLRHEEILKAMPPRPHRTGEWVRYAVRGKKRPFEGFIRIAVVPPLAAPGQPFWMEIAAGSGAVTDVHLKYQTESLQFRMKTLRRLFFSLGGQAPVEVPLDMADEVPEPEPAEIKVRKIGRETVTTKAGTFEAQRMRATVGKRSVEMWFAPEKVPIFGLVRAEDAAGIAELEGTGDEAISELVVPF